MKRWACLLLAAAVGCGTAKQEAVDADSQGAGQVAAPIVVKGPAADVIVHDFLEAVRVSDKERASALLTPLARQKTVENDLEVAWPGSTTASFKVGEIELIGDEGAHVASFWTDLGEDGAPHTEMVVWIVRRLPEGWRVAGMAANVIPGEPPVVMNFEEPEEMLAQKKLVAEEIARREALETTVVDKPASNDKGVAGDAATAATVSEPANKERAAKTPPSAAKNPVRSAQRGENAYRRENAIER